MVKYFHSECGGKISILKRRCSKCGKKWPRGSWFQYPLPDDILISSSGKPPKVLKKRPVYYAKWANKYPEVARFASKLPNWPRWARILVLIGIIIVLVLLSYYLWGLIRWKLW